jgi:hypothetical protein
LRLDKQIQGEYQLPDVRYQRSRRGYEGAKLAHLMHTKRTWIPIPEQSVDAAGLTMGFQTIVAVTVKAKASVSSASSEENRTNKRPRVAHHNRCPTRSPFAVTITIIWVGPFDGHFYTRDRSMHAGPVEQIYLALLPRNNGASTENAKWRREYVMIPKNGKAKCGGSFQLLRPAFEPVPRCR